MGKRKPFTTLRDNYSAALLSRIQSVVDALQLTGDDLHWYQYGYMKDQDAINAQAKWVTKANRRHPGGCCCVRFKPPILGEQLFQRRRALLVLLLLNFCFLLSGF